MNRWTPRKSGIRWIIIAVAVASAIVNVVVLLYMTRDWLPIDTAVGGRRWSKQSASWSLASEIQLSRISLHENNDTSVEFHGPAVKILAYHFPQYHPFELNNRLWGQDFTEWNNVRKRSFNDFGFETLRPDPSVGYYNLMDVDVRRRQARMAKENGVDGFIYHIYWFDGKPVMEAPLLAMLQDGEPDLPFMFSWANEPWTSNWDGGTKAELQPQVYATTEVGWEKFFKYLLPWFKHPNYIKVQGKPVFSVYRMSEVTMADQMFRYWDDLAAQDDIPGVFVLQTLNALFTRGANRILHWVDGVVEFQPNYQGSYVHAAPVSAPRLHKVHHRGMYVAWDNTPRHSSDGKAYVTVMALPQLFGRALGQLVDKVMGDPNVGAFENFVTINAWNEFGEGCALEPSTQYGMGYLDAVRQVAHSIETSDKVIIIVRTYYAHDPRELGTLFDLHRSLRSLIALNHRNWVALVVDTDAEPFPDLVDLIAELDDGRIRHLAIQPSDSDAEHFGYPVTDRAIVTAARWFPDAHWLLVTNGDNTYHPTALDHLDRAYDLIGLNFASRWNSWNSADTERSQWDQRCTVLEPERTVDKCMPNGFKVSKLDLGSIFWNVKRFVHEKLTFSEMSEVCHMCEDGKLVEKAVENGWKSLAVGDSDTCLLMHEPNIRTCYELGGIWFDSPLLEEYGCHSQFDFDRFLKEKRLGGMFYNSVDIDLMRRDPWCVRYNRMTYVHAKASKRGPTCFDSVFYATMNPLLPYPFVTHERLYQHYVDHGKAEGRLSRFSCGTAKSVKFLFIVRTYFGHSLALSGLLQSLVNLEQSDWVAVVVNTDPRPFDDLKSIVKSFNHPRMLILPVDWEPLEDTLSDHDWGYAATDYAVGHSAKLLRARNFEEPDHVVFTNGDNLYSPNAFSDVHGGFDMYLLPFESRWAMSDLMHRENYEWYDRCQPGMCLEGEKRLGGADLGGIVFNFRRFLMAERHAFSGFYAENCAMCQDGLLMMHLINSEDWRVRIVPFTGGECPFFHNPCRTICKTTGGVWFDSSNPFEMECLPMHDALHMIDINPEWYDRANFVANNDCLRYSKVKYDEVVRSSAPLRGMPPVPAGTRDDRNSSTITAGD